MIFSRSSKTEDVQELELNELILKYASLPKDFETMTARYKFWDYAIVFNALTAAGISELFDIGSGTDVSLATLCKAYNIQLTEMDKNSFMKAKINSNKYMAVSCLGELDYVINRMDLFNKLLRHVKVGGLLIITSTDEYTPKSYHYPLMPEDLLRLSVVAESQGYTLYGTDLKNLTDYKEISAPAAIHSLVLQRLGGR
jgi:hypothetical protein